LFQRIRQRTDLETKTCGDFRFTNIVYNGQLTLLAKTVLWTLFYQQVCGIFELLLVAIV
jgi:hypothetical protein